MKKEMRLIIDALSNKDDIDQETIFKALEYALAMAAKKLIANDAMLSVMIDRHSGEYQTFRHWTVLADDDLSYNKHNNFIISEIEQKDVVIGDTVIEKIESVDFGRIGAQAAKTIINQKLNEAKRKKTIEHYKNRIGEMLSGTVKKNARDFVVLDIGNNAEALLMRENMIGREIFRINDRVKAQLISIRDENKGPVVRVSRTHSDFITNLFALEVPEIGEGIIEIKSIARIPGQKTKIAVQSKDSRVEPKGACIGMQGSRIQAVSDQVCQERIDVILWDEDDVKFVINALSPIKVVSVDVNEEIGSMNIVVEQEELSKAIGKSGMNVRLNSELTGWKLNILSTAESVESDSLRKSEITALFIKALGIGQDFSEMLFEIGFESLEQIAYVDAQEFNEIEGLDADTINIMQEAARHYMLGVLLEEAEDIKKFDISKDILQLDGMTNEIAIKLHKIAIDNLDKIAELSIDELQEIHKIENDNAAKIIMAARQHWFLEG